MIGRILNVLIGVFSIFRMYALLCAIGFIVIVQAVRVVRAHQNKEKIPVKHLIGIAVFLFYLSNVYHVTGMGTIWDLPIYGMRNATIHWIPFVDLPSAYGTYGIEGIFPWILNVIMTIPLGFMLPLLWPNMHCLKKVALIGLCFSMLIEFSQLFNNRATMTEDLITNTLGAVIGYLTFKCLKRMLPFRQKEQTINKPTTFIGRHEAVICIISSYLSVFFLYNPWGLIEIRSNLGINEEITGDFTLSVNDFILIEVVELDTHGIWGELIVIKETEFGWMSASYPGKTPKEDLIHFSFDETVSFILMSGDWRHPDLTEATFEDIVVGDSLNIFGNYLEGIFIVERVEIARL